MIILALDPSLTCTGYAILEADPTSPRLVSGGVLRPPGQRKGRKLTTIERTQALGVDLRLLMAEASPYHVVIEVSSGKVNHGRHGGSGAGLATYGQACGYLLAIAETAVERWAKLGATEPRVHCIYENEWIGRRAAGGVPARKPARAALMPIYFPDVTYDASKDRGYDTADAALLGRWFCLHRLPGLMSRCNVKEAARD